MIYLFMALYCEAHALIEHYELCKNTDISKYQVFENENIRLTITGSGSIPAAVAVTYICTRFGVSGQDTVVNLGICAGPHEQIGKIFCCNKIIDSAARRSYYPDMLYRQNFAEKTIETVYGVVTEHCGENLWDMESCGVYQASVRFVPVHRIIFLKIVSDSGEVCGLDSGRINELFAGCVPCLDAYFDGLIKNTAEETEEKDMEDEGTYGLVRDLKCSDVMEKALRQLLRYCRSAGIDYRTAVQEMYASGKLPCRSKREGKIYLEELRKQLL